MENICYVIMPYGGDDPVMQSKFEGIFRSIISTAAREAGFSDSQIIREDHRGEAGSIIKNIVHHLTSSSVIIADLTNANANVHYELGIAHVFHKSSTVLICEKGTRPAFDLQSLNIIQYSTNIDAMAASVEKIKAAIIQRRDGLSSSDNIVHEFVTDLPTHLLDLLEMDEDQTQAQLKKTTMEYEALKRRLEAAGIQTDGPTGQQSIRSILTATKERLKYSGNALLNTLRNYAESNDLENFLDFLISAMELGTPTISEINSIVEICAKLDNTSLLEDVLSASLILYPGDTELMTRLAKLYARRPATRSKAMEMVNSAIGLKRGPDGNYVSVDRSKLSHNDLARFLDTYNNLENYTGLVEAAKFLMAYVPEKEREMLTRNIFSALTRNGDLDRAAEYLPAMEAMHSDLGKYMMSTYYNKRGDFVREYECLEKAFITDPEDMDYPRILAAHMLNEKLVRTPNGIEKVSPQAARRAAAALLYHIIENRLDNKNTLIRIRDLMQRSINRMDDFWAAAIPFINRKAESLPYENTDRYPLDYLLAQVSED